MAIIKIQLNQLLIELSGSEEFVKSQYDELAEKYRLYEKAEGMSDGVSSQMHEAYENSVTNFTNKGNDWSSLFSLGDNGAISINMTVPGNNKAERMKNLVFLIGYAKRNEWVPFAVAAEECRRQGCWDSKNFASYVKQLGSNVMISGKDKSKSFRLTAIGLEAAKDKIKDMLGEK